MAGLAVPRDQRFLCRGILIRCFLGLKMETKHRLCFVTVFNPEIHDSFGKHAHQLLPLSVRTHWRYDTNSRNLFEYETNRLANFFRPNLQRLI